MPLINRSIRGYGKSTNSQITDVNSKYTTLVLSGETPTNTFTQDASNYNNDLTIVGDTRPSKFSPYTDGYYSNYFGGSTDYLTLPSSSTAYNFGVSVDFTVEAWVYPTVLAGAMWGIIDARASGATPTAWLLSLVPSGGTYRLEFYNAGANDGTTSIPLNAWTHVAASRVGSNLRLYVNGILDTTITSYGGSISPGTTAPRVGTTKDASGTNYATTGYISNLRIVNGTGLYSSNFTPSTTPLTAIANTSLLTCQNNRFNDSGPLSLVLTPNGGASVRKFNPFPPTTDLTNSGSTYFDGTGDYLSIPTNTAFDFGTGDFTVEAWVYPNSLATDWFIISASGSGGFFFGFSSSSTIGYGWGRAAVAWDYRVASTATVGAWQHVAVTRSGTSMRLFVNGVQAGTTQTISTAYNLGTTSTNIGSQGANYYLTGNIADLRVVKGTALYTSSFAPPTRSLKTITADVFLQATSFNGASQYLTVPYSSAFNIPINTAVTFECWVYTSSAASGVVLVGRNWAYGGSGPTWGFELINGVTPRWDLAGTGESTYVMATSSVSGALGQWNHYAFTRDSSNVVNIWVNGVSGVTRTDGQALTNASGDLYIGVATNLATASYFNGSIANMRMVIGQALFTGTFTPSTASLTSTSVGHTGANVAASLTGTVSLITCQGPTIKDSSPNNFTVTNVGGVNFVSLPQFSTSLLTSQTSVPVNNSMFFDSSGLDSRIIRTGNPAITNITPYGDNWSYYFNGTTDGLTISGTESLSLASVDYTFECWVYLNTSIVQTTAIISKDWTSGTTYPSFLVGLDNTYKVQFTIGSGTGSAGGALTVATTTTVPLNTWTHIAVSRYNGNISIYINGVRGAFAADTGTIGISSSPFKIGLSDNPIYFPGYISNLRFIRGQGLYTNDFTPSKVPLSPTANTILFTATSNKIIDTAANSYPIVNTYTNSAVLVTKNNPFDRYIRTPKSYSYRFNGTSTKLTVPNSPDLDLASQNTDFTIECWVFPTLPNVQQGFVQKDGTSGSIYPQYALAVLSTNLIAFTVGPATSVGAQSIYSSKTLQFNRWTHIAAVKSGTSIAIYMDGELVSGPTQINSNGMMANGTGPLTIGYTPTSADFFKGLISNLRIVKQAVYTSAFTPQDGPLTPIAGTVLLTCQDTTIKDNSRNNYNITRINDKIVSANPFTYNVSAKPLSYNSNLYGGSAYYDGAGDYLTVNENSIQRLSNAFTIQGWFNATSQIAANIAIVSKGTATTGWEIGVGRANTLLFTNATVALQSTTAINFNEWNHFAVVRENSGNLTRVYLNGNLEVTGVITNPFTETSNIYIGSGRVAGANVFTGYIAGIQIDAAALYTSNSLIVPITALTRTANTVFYLENVPAIVDYANDSGFETLGDVKLKPASPYLGSYYGVYGGSASDFLQISSNAAFAFPGAFTVEGWFYWPTIPSAGSLLGAQGAGGFNFYTDGTYLGFNIYGTGNVCTVAFPSRNVWHHVAMTRDGSNNCTIWIDGASVATGTSAQSFAQAVWSIYGGSTGGGGGYISNHRVVKGTALYTTAFTPSSTPLTVVPNTSLLTAHTNNFIDVSTNKFPITKNNNARIVQFTPFSANVNINDFGNSIYFDGNGDYLKWPLRTDALNFNTGDFTVEFWMYPEITTANEWELIEATTTNAFTIYKRSGSAGFSYRGYANTDVLILSDSNLVSNAWTHIAVSRSNSYTTAWVNGLKVANTFDLTNYIIPSTNMTMGNRINGTSNFTGYIRDFRVTKGVGKYTSNGWPLPNKIVTNKPYKQSPVIDFSNNTVVVDYLAVGGGGAGGVGAFFAYPGSTPGSAGGGGGGGGGVLFGNISLAKNQLYTISVGAGGRGADIFLPNQAIQAGNTTFTGGGLTITAFGGGYGGGLNYANATLPAGSGGSGGGGGSTFTIAGLGGGNWPGQGFTGNVGPSGTAGGAGGSGAGTRGELGANVSSSGGLGGYGANIAITGVTIMYGAGGGGSGGNPGGSGGAGGGGGTAGGPGGDNTGSPKRGSDGITYGSGGGGMARIFTAGGSPTEKSGNGAPGVFIIRTPSNVVAQNSGNANIIVYGTNIVYQYTSPGTFVITGENRATFFANILVVAGGGGGGGVLGGGGGAGGFRTGTIQMAAGLRTAVIVGGGGGAGTAFSNGTNGSNSSITLFSNITATGGGYGGYYTGGGATPGGAGGSGGGGGAGGSGQGSSGGAGNYEPFTPVQGYAGGNNYAVDGSGSAGGGGGASQVGSAGGSNNAGKGGDGAPSFITGSNVIYAGGGAGGSTPGANGGGGAGGGGSGTRAGNVNTGGGGGGGNGPDPGTPAGWVGSAGGSGIVIIAYPDIFPIATSNSGATYSLVNNNRTYSFTTSGSITF